MHCDLFFLCHLKERADKFDAVRPSDERTVEEKQADVLGLCDNLRNSRRFLVWKSSS